MSKATQAQEPSMEEILASIRRIISDDETTGEAVRAGVASSPLAASGAGAATPSPAAPKSGPIGVVETAAEAGDEEGGGNSQADIDALFANEESDSGSGAAADWGAAEEAEDEASGADETRDAEPDVLELTPEMRVPDKDAEKDEAEPDFPVAGFPGSGFEAGDNDVVFREDDEPVAAAPPSSTGAETRPGNATAPSGGQGRLLSPGPDAAVSAAFSNLATMILSKDARTLEDLVSEMLRPLLKAWLDDNLPPLVERLVREEIERVSRGRR